MIYKCLIVDDEEPARNLIRSYIEKIPDLEAAAVCKNVMEAKSVLLNEEIDIMFLDIQMPELSGIEFLRMLKKIPATVLITAYSNYAIEGYELDVVDYLLKPVEFGRFYKAATKAIDFVKKQDPSAQKGETAAPAEKGSVKQIFVKADKEILKFDVDKIIFIESQREYVKIVTAKTKVMTLQSLSKFEEILPAEKFARVHRSFIVNIDTIDKIIGNTIFIKEHRIPISRGQRQTFIDMINKDKLF